MTRQTMTNLAAPSIEAGMDPTSANSRVGLGALLRELERLEPGAVRRLPDAARYGGGRSRR